VTLFDARSGDARTFPASRGRLENRRVFITELQEALDRPLTSTEREETLLLVRWFSMIYCVNALPEPSWSGAHQRDAPVE
jgi:hypothetical protein